LSIYEKLKGKESIDCANTIQSIGNVYDNQNKFNEAIRFYNRALTIKERVKGKESVESAITLKNIG